MQRFFSTLNTKRRLKKSPQSSNQKGKLMTEKQMRVLSVVATLTAVGMYVSYIPQIQNNLAGNPGSPLQPLVAAINCTLWVAYGFLKENRDYPVMLANAPGIILGLITFITSF